MILQLRFSNSGCSPAIYPSSVVHTGVKSLGCENKMAQPLPIHSWKLIVPCEVSAVKLGASSFIRNMVGLLVSGFLSWSFRSDLASREHSANRDSRLGSGARKSYVSPAVESTNLLPEREAFLDSTTIYSFGPGRCRFRQLSQHLRVAPS